MATNIQISALTQGNDLEGEEFIPMSQYDGDNIYTRFTRPWDILAFIRRVLPEPPQIVPLGGIIMYAGSSENFDIRGFGKVNTEYEPYVLCNGVDIPADYVQAINLIKSPDLSNRFVIGASSTRKIGDIGGEEKHAMTIDELVPHTHTVKAPPGTPSKNDSATHTGDGNHLVDARILTSASTGGGKPFNLLPPYYTLAYIMRYKTVGWLRR